MPETADIASYFEVFAGYKWPLTIKIRKKVGEIVLVPAFFHHSPATSNLFDKPGLAPCKLVEFWT